MRTVVLQVNWQLFQCRRCVIITCYLPPDGAAHMMYAQPGILIRKDCCSSNFRRLLTHLHFATEVERVSHYMFGHPVPTAPTIGVAQELGCHVAVFRQQS